MRVRWLRLGLASLVIGVAPVRAAEPTILIRNVSVVTLDDRGTLSSASVLVSGKRISAVLPKGAALPKAGRTLDGTGKYLIPGLIDAHTHFEAPNELASFLRYGVTTVFALGAQSD